MESLKFLESHPLGFVYSLRERYGDELLLSFSRYRYSPKTRKDDRFRFKVPIGLVDSMWFAGQLGNLDSLQELALESVVKVGKRVRHIPMLDFRGMTKGQLSAILEIFPSNYSNDLQVYQSGRSYHAYFLRLLTPSQWIKFMGSSLLCNSPTDGSVVDQRWVGHRLIAGYSALRWSCNTPHYKSYPTKVDAIELDRAYFEKRAEIASRMNTVAHDRVRYLEGLVEWVLKSLSIEYSRGSPQTGYVKPHGFDFLLKLGGRRSIAIEVVSSESRYLTEKLVRFIANNTASSASRGEISALIVIAGPVVMDEHKRLLLASDVPIYVIDQARGPQDVLPRLKGLLAELSHVD